MNREIKWGAAPARVEFGPGMVLADIAITPNETLTVYCHESQTKAAEALLGAVPQQRVGGAQSKTKCEPSECTPGPWVADLGARPIMVHSEPETWPLVDELGDEEGRVGVFVANTGDNKANARLIAAAPDLLEALQGLLGALSVRIDDPRVRFFDAARAAISKAGGDFDAPAAHGIKENRND